MKSAPDYIQFYPTLRCNRSCGFCFNRDLPSVEDMPLEQFRTMLAGLRPRGVRTIDIIGGEPTLHPGILLMVREAEQSGFRTNISSNGDDVETLERILEIGKHTSVGISVNDRETLQKLRAFIGSHHPVVKTVFSPGLDSGMIDDILALHPKRFYLLYRDAMHQEELRSTVPFHRFIETVRSRYSPERVGTVSCSGFLPDTAAYPELSDVRCPAGTTKLGIMPDGSVYPCNLFFGRTAFRLGNVLTDPFERIWTHPALAFFRTFAGNDCPRNTCTIHAQCHGGCPAHSLLLSKSLSGPDPRCVERT